MIFYLEEKNHVIVHILIKWALKRDELMSQISH